MQTVAQEESITAFNADTLHSAIFCAHSLRSF
jgi:hypothetical protein